MNVIRAEEIRINAPPSLSLISHWHSISLRRFFFPSTFCPEDYSLLSNVSQPMRQINLCSCRDAPEPDTLKSALGEVLIVSQPDFLRSIKK